MLPLEHSAILLTFIKQKLVFFFEWPLKKGFTVKSGVNIHICIQVSVSVCRQRIL